MAKAELLYIKDKPVSCPICGCDIFYRSRAQLNTAGMTFFKLDWLNQSAHTYTCSDCGHILWFADL